MNKDTLNRILSNKIFIIISTIILIIIIASIINIFCFVFDINSPKENDKIFFLDEYNFNKTNYELIIPANGMIGCYNSCRRYLYCNDIII